MTEMRKYAAVALAGTLIALGAAFPAAGAGKYDGSWSVVVITDRGDCDRAYRYPVTVVNGVITYSGETGVTISGRIDGSGRLRASIRRGEQHAEGSGRVNGTSGTGTWSGRDAVKACSGHWEAEKRAG